MIPLRADAPAVLPRRISGGALRRQPTLLGRAVLLLCCLCLAAPALAADFPLDFTLIRMGEASRPQPAAEHAEEGRTVLVVGGIQGDEPGGFSAATLLTTHYTVTGGSLWVVPNLNFPSIIKRSRGLHGDMNRKFARLDASDPEFSTVRRIQELISHPQVGLVLNLHDGSGYYRPRYEDKLRNPARWGQSVIIDQEELPDAFMGTLGETARRAAAAANGKLIAPGHRLHVHNTRTAEGDREMEKSLSYYAVRQGKAAFGLEASKEFPVELRAYYHLLMLESFLQQAGLQFSRGFELTPAGVRKALLDKLDVSFVDNRIFLPLDDVRPAINLLPMSREAPARAVTSKPIMAVLPCAGDREGQYCVHYGNRRMTLIRPEWREMDDSLSGMRVQADGRELDIPFGQVLRVSRSLRVLPAAGYRVNAIGFGGSLRDESDISLARKDFNPRFSVDRQGRLYRIEVYREQRFSGMFLVRFDTGADRPARRAASRLRKDRLPDRPGPESRLGF